MRLACLLPLAYKVETDQTGLISTADAGGDKKGDAGALKVANALKVSPVPLSLV